MLRVWGDDWPSFNLVETPSWTLQKLTPKHKVSSDLVIGAIPTPYPVHGSHTTQCSVQIFDLASILKKWIASNQLPNFSTCGTAWVERKLPYGRARTDSVFGASQNDGCEQTGSDYFWIVSRGLSRALIWHSQMGDVVGCRSNTEFLITWHHMIWVLHML